MYLLIASVFVTNYHLLWFTEIKLKFNLCFCIEQDLGWKFTFTVWPWLFGHVGTCTNLNKRFDQI